MLARSLQRGLAARSWTAPKSSPHVSRSVAARAGPQAQPGDLVAVNYTGKLDDGTVFDSSRNPGRTPLEFTVGGGQVIKGFDTAVTGLAVGESRTSRIPPKDAYGEVDEQLRIKVPMDRAPKGLTPGAKVQLSNGAIATILSVTDSEVEIDANHELAGKALTFDVELVRLTQASSLAKATFGMGCFWGPELQFQRIPGVVSTEVGYCNGQKDNPTYEDVCSGTTGHAEVVRVNYNPDEVTYEQLLDVFWSKHDPTTLNRQGGDMGTQYRSGIYAHSPEQLQTAKASMEQEQAKRKAPIVSEITEIGKYYTAEAYHQQYLARGGRNGRAQDPSKGCTDPVRCYG